MEITSFFITDGAILGCFPREKWNRLTPCMAHCFRNDVKWAEALDATKLREFADYNFKLDENDRSSLNGWKMPFTSNFSFSDTVFKRCELQTGKNQGLFENGTLKSLKLTI